ncbi:MAG: hypothetical protein WEA58_12560 [Balneolaceae bacterium]
MSKKSVLDILDQLPPSARKEAEGFVRFLYDQYVTSPPKKSTDSSITESPFVGMWKDREDLKDSTAWVREQRKSQWGHQ